MTGLRWTLVELPAAADPRWPRLGPAARTNQIRGVLSAPVLKDGRPIGTCNALTTSPRAWTEADMAAIRAYADMLAQLVGSASDARHKGELAAQLQVALASRVLVEQAKGVLMERHGLDDQAAFTRLRRQARSSARKLTDVARQVIDDRGHQPRRLLLEPRLGAWLGWWWSSRWLYPGRQSHEGLSDGCWRRVLGLGGEGRAPGPGGPAVRRAVGGP